MGVRPFVSGLLSVCVCHCKGCGTDCASLAVGELCFCVCCILPVRRCVTEAASDAGRSQKVAWKCDL